MKLKALVLFSAAAIAAVSSMADEPLGSWLSNRNQHGDETWQTGKLAGIADEYKRRIAAAPADYEARILHAATILLQLGENKNVAAYAKKFGFTLDYLGMKVTGSSSKPSAWPAANTMVDTFVKEGIPVLRAALADLEGIPSGWSGSVRISKDEFPVDDDVYVDMGDVLYARAGLEAAIGLAYFAHGYDLTLDYTKAVNAFDYGPTVQTLKRAPVSESDDLWNSIADGADCGSRGVTSLKLGYFGKKMYIRMAGDIEDLVDDGRHAARSIYLSMEDSSDEPCWGLLLTDDRDNSMQQGDGYVARVFTAAEADTWWEWDFPANRMVPVNMTQSGDAVQFEIDLSKFANYAKAGAWSVGWGEVCLYSKWIEGYYSGYWMCEWDVVESPDDFPAQLYKLLTEQTKFMAKVRNQSSLPQSRSWMKAAFNHALMADAAVKARTDGNMHFVEYDPVDADAIDCARSLTEKALASLDAAQEIDIPTYLGEDIDFDFSLLPNDGVMQVYLGALFEGKVTRDLLPTFLKGADEGPVPVMETIKDPTIAGLLPEFTVRAWNTLLRGIDVAVLHQPVTVKLDANGGKVAKKDVTLGFDEESEENFYPELPIPTRAGFIFTGWATAKAGGKAVREEDVYDASLFSGAKAPTLYAQWLQLYALTVKGADAGASWDWSDEQRDSLPDGVLNGEYGRELDGKGVVNVPAGAVVSISAPPDIEDNKKKKLVFQKWMSSSAKADLGQDFKVGASETQFAMPAEKLAMTATYVDESTCGRLRAFFWEANEVHVGWSDELAEDVYIYPPYEAFEWTPDGKTWYKCGDSALLKAGSYTVSWRSTDPRWSAPSLREKVKVEAGEESSPMSISIFYTYVPQVVVDVVTFENGELRKSSAGGTFTMNPKDGLVPMDKTAALTAKANKNYSFQGWALAKGWEYGDCFEEKSADWKLVNCSGDSYPATEGRLNRYIDPDDGMVHVLAVFKALDDYSADDIEFYGFSGYNPANDVSYDGDGNASFTMKAVAGCALDEDVIAIDCAPGSFPLSYKLNGKLPDGLKFDAKTGVLSGAPKKAGTSTVTIVATDPAKNSKALTVNFDVAPLPSWLAGEYRGIMSEERFIGGHNEWDEESQQFVYVPMEILPGPQNGILELSVKSDGKVSAKVVTGLGARSVSGTLVWFDPEARDDDVEGEFAEFRFYHYAKDDSECHVYFYSDGTIDGYADSYDKVNDSWAGGDMTGLRQAAEQMADSPFLDKYYTFAFSAEAEKDEETMQSGYGYLTIKTDKKGAAKVTGQLPDGEKVSMSAIVMPFVTNDVLKARLYLFASPSSYKKRDWFAMSLLISPDGTVVSEENAAWTPGVGTVCQEEEYGNAELLRQEAQVYGVGALYSEAKSLEDYYWTVHCDYSGDVALEYSWKELYYNDITGKDEPYTAYGYANALDFGGFFNVSVKGDKKGAISLAGKSPAPWVNKVDGESYWEFGVDKKGNEITDPSQLSISFTKATGIFTGKASVYFDEPKPTSASLPYAGVMIHGGDGIYEGFGSAVYSFKYSYEDDKGKQKTNTDKITLPVSLVPGFSNGGE